MLKTYGNAKCKNGIKFWAKPRIRYLGGKFPGNSLFTRGLALNNFPPEGRFFTYKMSGGKKNLLKKKIFLQFKKLKLKLLIKINRTKVFIFKNNFFSIRNISVSKILTEKI